jgi:hypothetical protein
MEKLISNNNLCAECYEPITNPVCSTCYLKEVVSWLNDQDIKDKKKEIIYTTLNEYFLRENPNLYTCILCQTNKLSVCSYCFFLITLKTLKKMHIPKSKLGNFIHIFNYHKWHSEYVV